MNEAETRAEHIDPVLAAAGWGVIEGSRILREYPITPGRIEGYQNRSRGVTILARLDFGGAPHRNPDDEEIDCPHLHVYREGFGDRWAFPLPPGRFSDPGDPWLLLLEFMQFVNVTVPPDVRRGLFT